jgi:hypothetical protein
MTPAASCPGVTTGSDARSDPSIRCTSERQMPHAFTRTSTSAGPGSGTGTSCTLSSRVALSKRAARIVVIRRSPDPGSWIDSRRTRYSSADAIETGRREIPRVFLFASSA